VYEYGGVFPVTYPPWYDESYWYGGLKVWLGPRHLVDKFLVNAKGVAELLIYQGGGFLLGWIACFFLQKDKSTFRNLIRSWPAWVVSVAAIILYCFVHVEPRHVGAFAAIIFLVPFTLLRIPRKQMAAVVAVVGLVWAGCFYWVTTTQGERFRPWDSTPQNVSWQVASGLQRFGLTTDDRVASVCLEGMLSARWARLAKVHIVSELDPHANFWLLGEADQQRVMTALSSSGAKMAISCDSPPDSDHAAGWRQIASTNYYVHSL
jgi:hypothetical protein